MDENQSEIEMVTCKDCEFWQPFEDDPHKGICKHPERDDKKSVHYYGFIKASSYCAKISKKVGKVK